MLTNATLLRIDTPGQPKTSGERQWVLGSTISVRCALIADDSADAQQGDTRLAQGRAAIVRIPTSVTNPISLVTESRLLIVGDGDDGAIYRVRSVGRFPKGSLSFIEAKVLRD